MERPLPLGMPTYMASGGHYFGPSRYRFLILPRYDFDLHSIIRNRQVDTKNILIIATQLLDILEHIHDCGYAHSDIKAENIMIGKCSYKKGGAATAKNNGGKLNKQGGGGKGGGAAAATATAATATLSATDKRKINRRLRMTLVSNDSAASDVHRQSSKRTAKSKSYAESHSSFSSNKSDDSDFSEDFDKLSDEDDDDDDDEDDELDEEDDSDNEQEENDSGETFLVLIRNRSRATETGVPDKLSLLIFFHLKMT